MQICIKSFSCWLLWKTVLWTYEQMLQRVWGQLQSWRAQFPRLLSLCYPWKVQQFFAPHGDSAILYQNSQNSTERWYNLPYYLLHNKDTILHEPRKEICGVESEKTKHNVSIFFYPSEDVFPLLELMCDNSLGAWLT
jgi:hypothetical protein